ncbi:hypothetical protein D3C72_780330 [compost metagenome]
MATSLEPCSLPTAEVPGGLHTNPMLTAQASRRIEGEPLAASNLGISMGIKPVFAAILGFGLKVQLEISWFGLQAFISTVVLSAPMMVSEPASVVKSGVSSAREIPGIRITEIGRIRRIRVGIYIGVRIRIRIKIRIRVGIRINGAVIRISIREIRWIRRLNIQVGTHVSCHTGTLQ